MKRKQNAPATAAPLPHSWTVQQWPVSVFPCNAGKARYLVRVHRDELLKAGALVRIGRELVVFGEPFSRWLQRGASKVQNYRIAPNLDADRSAA